MVIQIKYSGEMEWNRSEREIKKSNRIACDHFTALELYLSTNIACMSVSARAQLQYTVENAWSGIGAQCVLCHVTYIFTLKR